MVCSAQNAKSPAAAMVIHHANPHRHTPDKLFPPGLTMVGNANPDENVHGQCVQSGKRRGYGGALWLGRWCADAPAVVASTTLSRRSGSSEFQAGVKMPTTAMVVPIRKTSLPQAKATKRRSHGKYRDMR